MVLAVAGLAMAPASADHVVPTDVADNTSCEAQGYDFEFKIDETPADGDYAVSEAESGVVGGGTVTIDNAGVVDGVFEFDWSSDIAWDALIVKQGNANAVYTYVPPSTGDEDVTPSLTDEEPNGSISHITFCRDNVVTTTTEEETTTTVEETTTTTEATTTSETVLGSTVTQGQPTTEATVKGIQVTRQLPRTGVQTELMLYAAASLIACGLALLATGRRRSIAR